VTVPPSLIMAPYPQEKPIDEVSSPTIPDPTATTAAIDPSKTPSPWTVLGKVFFKREMILT
jgi:hypothetical protein